MLRRGEGMVKKKLVLEKQDEIEECIKRLVIEGDEYETVREIDLALHAWEIVAVIDDVRNALRAMVKYQDKEIIEIDEVRDMITREIADRNLERFFS